MRTIQDLFRKSKQEWLEEARINARNLALKKSVITIEDVLQVCPLPKYLHRNTIGSVFTRNEFEPIGYTHSRRRVSHGRTIRTWVLKDTNLPSNWSLAKASAIDGDNTRLSVVD